MKRIVRSRVCRVVLLAAAVGLATAPLARAAAPLAGVSVSPGGLEWQAAGDFEKLSLTISGPGGTILTREFRAGVSAVFEPFGNDGKSLADGAYVYELKATPRIDAETRRALDAARKAGDDNAIAALQRSGKLPSGPLVQSGTFAVKDGSIVANDLKEPRAAAKRAAAKGLGVITGKDLVTADDSIVQGSLCVGLDCVNNESFGFDTIRLKENNTRVKFEDTSVGAFPANDWQLTANDSASGGANKFSIEDVTGSKVPFTITAGAATDSIFLDSTGRLGLRTATPVLDIHISTSNTPAMRMEQTSAGGFTAQTWDIAGNEANFFIRDVTGGSRLPFRIRPGAPTSAIDISASGNVGMGTAAPSNSLHVTRSDGTTKVLVKETSATTTPREMMEVNNNGGAIIIYKDTSLTPRWSTGTSGNSFVWDNQAHTGVEFSLDQNGNAVFLGTVTPSSSRTVKEGFNSVEPREVLRKVAAMPITTWSYKHDPSVRHIGPMAEDFFSAFAVGADAKGISVTDSAGVTLAAIQGLNEVVQEKDQQIAELRQANAELKSRLDVIEAMVKSLAAEPRR
jgi:hypothetical protein